MVEFHSCFGWSCSRSSQFRWPCWQNLSCSFYFCRYVYYVIRSCHVSLACCCNQKTWQWPIWWPLWAYYALFLFTCCRHCQLCLKNESLKNSIPTKSLYWYHLLTSIRQKYDKKAAFKLTKKKIASRLLVIFLFFPFLIYPKTWWQFMLNFFLVSKHFNIYY